MAKINVNNAEGDVLNYLVAVCEPGALANWPNYRKLPNYSTEWSQGGPIIEREKIDIRHTITEGGYRTSESGDAVHATIILPNGATGFDSKKVIGDYGPTPLIAAMRCYVASKLGDVVEVPKELM